MEAAAGYIVVIVLLAFAGAVAYVLFRWFKPAEPGKNAPIPPGFHERPRMGIQEFYETYYLKPGSPIRMSHVEQGLGLFSMQAHVPQERLRPTDRLADFGQRSDGFFTSIATIGLQQAIAKNPKLAGCKMETVDDLIQLVAKAEAEQEQQGTSSDQSRL